MKIDKRFQRVPGTEQTQKFSHDVDDCNVGRKKSIDKYQIPHILCYLLHVKYYFELLFDSRKCTGFLMFDI